MPSTEMLTTPDHDQLNAAIGRTSLQDCHPRVEAKPQRSRTPVELMHIVDGKLNVENSSGLIHAQCPDTHLACPVHSYMHEFWRAGDPMSDLLRIDRVQPGVAVACDDTVRDAHALPLSL